MWDVEATDEFTDWYERLSGAQREAVNAAVDLLAEEGPGLKRPLVGTLSGSRLHNLKELRIQHGGHLRILFVFDPRRAAILLVGGDKSGQWDAWYREAIPQAERLYEHYLEELRQEGFLR